MDDILPIVKDALLKERKTALSIAEILRDGEDSPWYQQMEAAFQNQIQEVLDQVKENSALLSSAHPSPEIQQEADRLRGELSEIIRKKQDLKKFIARKNSWLELFRNLPEEFTLTQEITKKYIHQIDLYRDRPLTVTPKEYREKEHLLACLKLGQDTAETKAILSVLTAEGNTAKEKGESENGTKEPPECAAVSTEEDFSRPDGGSDSHDQDRDLCPTVPV